MKTKMKGFIIILPRGRIWIMLVSFERSGKGRRLVRFREFAPYEKSWNVLFRRNYCISHIEQVIVKISTCFLS
jgi:hypothetical protein